MMIVQNRTIWSHPIAVMACLSKSLGAQQRVGEVDEQRHGHEAGERIVECHGCPLKTGRRRRRTRSTERRTRGRRPAGRGRAWIAPFLVGATTQIGFAA